MEKWRLRFHENWGLFWRASRTPPPGYSLTATLAKGGGGTFTSCGGHARVHWPLPLGITSHPGACTGPAATVSVPKEDDERLPFSSLLTLKHNDGSRAGHPTGHGGAAGEGRLIWEPRSAVQGSWCLQEKQQAFLGFGPAAVSQGMRPDHGILRDRVRCSIPVVSWEKSWVSGPRPWLWGGLGRDVAVTKPGAGCSHCSSQRPSSVQALDPALVPVERALSWRSSWGRAKRGHFPGRGAAGHLSPAPCAVWEVWGNGELPIEPPQKRQEVPCMQPMPGHWQDGQQERGWHSCPTSPRKMEATPGASPRPKHVK